MDDKEKAALRVGLIMLGVVFFVGYLLGYAMGVIT